MDQSVHISNHGRAVHIRLLSSSGPGFRSPALVRFLRGECWLQCVINSAAIASGVERGSRGDTQRSGFHFSQCT
jgi:hypothetical protein